MSSTIKQQPFSPVSYNSFSNDYHNHHLHHPHHHRSSMIPNENEKLSISNTNIESSSTPSMITPSASVRQIGGLYENKKKRTNTDILEIEFYASMIFQVFIILKDRIKTRVCLSIYLRLSLDFDNLFPLENMFLVTHKRKK